MMENSLVVNELDVFFQPIFGVDDSWSYDIPLAMFAMSSCISF